MTDAELTAIGERVAGNVGPLVTREDVLRVFEAACRDREALYAEVVALRQERAEVPLTSRQSVCQHMWDEETYSRCEICGLRMERFVREAGQDVG